MLIKIFVGLVLLALGILNDANFSHRLNPSTTDQQEQAEHQYQNDQSDQNQNQTQENGKNQHNPTQNQNTAGGNNESPDSDNNSDSQNNDSPETSKVAAYNHSSGKVINSVAQVATEKSPVLESCQTNQNLCEPTPTPTPKILPPIKPLPTGPPEPLPDPKEPIPIPTDILPPVCYPPIHPEPRDRGEWPDMLVCLE